MVIIFKIKSLIRLKWTISSQILTVEKPMDAVQRLNGSRSKKEENSWAQDIVRSQSEKLGSTDKAKERLLLARSCVSGNNRAPWPPPRIRLRMEPGMAQFAGEEWIGRMLPANRARGQVLHRFARKNSVTRSARTRACSVQSFMATP